MRALITGASGFVGSTLCEELNKRGVEVQALMRKTSSRSNLGHAKLTPVEGDLRSAESLVQAVRNVDVIYHVAGVVAARNREDFFSANAAGTRNIVEAAKKNPKLQRLVYVSSLAAAGPSQPDRLNLESDETRPVSFYGESKLGGEREVLAAKDEIPVTIIRPPAVYGPRDRGVFTFFQMIQRGLLPLLGMQSPDPRRYSFVHVDDLVQGIALAGEAKQLKSGEIFYISGNGEFSWEEAMRLVAKGMQKRPMPLRLPIPVMKGAGALCTAFSLASGKALPFSLDKVKEIAAMAWTCSNEKAKRELKFEPYWDLERGFAQTAKWYKDNGWL
ncbi:MAG: NAD-dependent epimerase/dehydratase family protein [Bacteriovoracia bacterium]